ncbi:MAG: transglutaminase domain-containing protein [Planctomycetes bacterium]|nr:transglutaminase domain-containing protein [Planctomycetota bacterium]
MVWLNRKLLPVLVSAVVLVGLLGCPARGDEPVRHQATLSAVEAYEKGMGAWDVRAADDGKGVVLYDRVLLEDDGPGIGSDAKWLTVDKAPVETIEGMTQVKKVLHVERPEAIEAYLVLPEGVSEIKVNGSPIAKDGRTKYPPVPTALLRAGDNEIVLSCPEGKAETIKIATPEDLARNAPERAGQPRRSFKSTDGGASWEPVNGEYLVRLHVIQYKPQGRLVSPVIDLGRAADDGNALLAAAAVRTVALKTDAETPEGTAIALSVRSGPCPVYDESQWSAWRSVSIPFPRGHRYVQWQATLSSSDPLKTPILRSVTATAEVVAAPRPEWAAKARVTGVENPEILYTSIPFAYEDFRHPKLAELRRKYKLDEVVADGRNEFEKLLLLRNWVAAQWKYKPATDGYPAWDADEILTLKKGFCVQYAIVYMQCCLSLGYNARFVFGYHPGVMNTGHEIVEVWSNQYNHWVMMDANGNLHHGDARTNEPLSMLEVHDRMLAAYYGDKEMLWANRPESIRGVESLTTCRKMETEASYDDPTKWKKPAWPRYAKWGIIRMMPRNNFYAQQYPLPKTQGFHWDWSDYWVWEDARTPRSYAYRYRNITGRRADWEWTLNRVRFDAACRDEPGTVAVQMGTFTPGFETFLVNIDSKGWQPSGRQLTWSLHDGRNRIEMRVRNVLGVEGPVSHMEIDYGK